MYKLAANLLATLFLVIAFSGCKHICDCEDDGIEPCAFSYERVSYNPSGAPGDQLISPVFENEQPEGSFSAMPDGLAIDPHTGIIDVNASEYGQEYVVKFRLKDSEVICQTNIFIDEPDAQICDLDYDTHVAIPGQVELLQPKFDGNTELNGTFTAIPPGLDINPKSGVISVNTSEAGVKYRVMYTSHDKSTMCETEILVSGIDYLDVIIDLEDDIEDETISPIVDADPQLPVPDGQYDVDGRASSQGLAISPETGEINVRQTLLQVNRLRSGEDNPNEIVLEDGEKLEFTFKYIIGNFNQDAEVTATQEIIIYWFEDEVSEEIRRLIEEKSLYPINGREMSPPPMIAVQGNFR